MSLILMRHVTCRSIQLIWCYFEWTTNAHCRVWSTWFGALLCWTATKLSRPWPHGYSSRPSPLHCPHAKQAPPLLWFVACPLQLARRIKQRFQSRLSFSHHCCTLTQTEGYGAVRLFRVDHISLSTWHTATHFGLTTYHYQLNTKRERLATLPEIAVCCSLQFVIVCCSLARNRARCFSCVI